MLKKILIAVVFLFLLSACGTAEPINEMSVKMGDFYFEPAVLTVPVDQPVTVTLVNEGAAEHDFVVEKIDVSSISSSGDVGGHHTTGAHTDYNLHVSVEPGGTSVLTFTANQPGTYQIFCSVPGHKEAGMVAELIVVSQ